MFVELDYGGKEKGKEKGKGREGWLLKSKFVSFCLRMR